MRAGSGIGQSDVVLECAGGNDMDQGGLEVRDKMEGRQRPLEAEAPVLLRFNPSTAPILRLALSSTAKTTTDQDAIRELIGLRSYADDVLKKRLEPVEGIAPVKGGCGLQDDMQAVNYPQNIAPLTLTINTRPPHTRKQA